MPTEYDASVLQVFADDLYKQARYIVVTTAIRYGLMTFLVSIVLSAVLLAYIPHQDTPVEPSTMVVPVFIVSFIGLAVGISEGNSKAFRLRLEAQEVLCQRQIELNTHPAQKESD